MVEYERYRYSFESYFIMFVYTCVYYIEYYEKISDFTVDKMFLKECSSYSITYVRRPLRSFYMRPNIGIKLNYPDQFRTLLYK